MIRKKELFVFILLCLVFLILSLAVVFFSCAGAEVLITENGKTQIYPLKKDRVVVLSHNTVVIENGEAYIKSADCPNQICVKTGRISKAGEQIACIPNGVLVEIKK